MLKAHGVLFRIYDIDQDGFVNDSELFVVMKMIVKEYSVTRRYNK